MLLERIKKIRRKKKWKKNNSNNYTKYRDIFGDPRKVHIGKKTYGDIYVSSPNMTNKILIGNYCSIAGDVKFLLGADHPLNFISTYPFNTLIIGKGISAISKGDIIVEDDVWIGESSIILSGVHIGQGAVIAAGAIVSKDVPAYAIVGGIPAKVIKYRFTRPVIDYMLTLDYSSLTEEMIKEHINDLYVEIDKLSLDDIKGTYGWFPKKK